MAADDKRAMSRFKGQVSGQAKPAGGTSNALIKSDPRVQSLKGYLELARNQIAAALPRHMTPERMMRIALTAAQRSEALMRCELGSIIKSVIEASELGLEPSGVLGHAYLVPYKGVAQLQVGYRGFIELAGRSGRVKSISAEVVYDCDVFEFEHGLNPKLRHVPELNRPAGAKRIAVYAVAQLLDGAVSYRVLGASDVERNRQSSQSYLRDPKQSPWGTHTDEMWRKTAVRALAKYLPLSPELTRVAVQDEYRDAGVIDAEAIPLPTTADETGVDPETGEIQPKAAKVAETNGKASDKIKKAFSKYNIPLDRLENRVGKPAAEWTEQDIEDLRAVFASLEEGKVTVDAALAPVASQGLLDPVTVPADEPPPHSDDDVGV
jgi:recombination protein RecT